MLENDFQKRVLKKLRLIKCSWWVRVAVRFILGLPDIIGLVNGRFIAIELKTKSKLRKNQAHTLKLIEKAGGLVFVMTPENEREILTRIARLSL